MMSQEIPYKIYLSEEEMPKQWYNVRADRLISNPKRFRNHQRYTRNDREDVRDGALFFVIGNFVL